ncbi:ABC transporter permease, partial [Roseisolibacter sp. H3M3-2]|uniref:ABC transporter permease n=1 Tax=Roseisolibacter sp. H3M3-2 TaxID=3031323 RepID=UPI0023DB0352
MLAKHPALSLVGGIGMAVGVAVCVGTFVFLSTNAFPTLPLPEGDRIVALENRDVRRDNEERRSLHDFVLWRETLRSVRELAAFRTADRNLLPGDAPPLTPPAPVRVAEMTAAGFRVARVAPARGRYLLDADERPGAPPVVVLGHEAWLARFAGDPGVVGRVVRLDGVAHTVVGVMPPDFAFPLNHQYWTPLRVDPAKHRRREGPALFLFGRLAPGATMAGAQAELDAVGRRTAAAFPASNATLRPMVMPYTHSLIDIQGTTVWMLAQMQLMMSFLLVVVALNVAVLVYARTATRMGEIAVRAALGASRRRIVVQLFVEGLVLSLAASAVGLALAQAGARLGNRIMEEETGAPFWADYSLRPATVLFTVGVAVVAAVIVGVIPALQATGRQLQANLRQLGGSTGPRLGRTWTALIVAQVAIAVAALPAAVNAGWSEIRGALTRPTYAPEAYLVAELRAGDAAASDSARFGAAVTELLARVRAEAGVAGATYAEYHAERIGRVEIEGGAARADADADPGAAASTSAAGHRVDSHGVGPGYLALFGGRVLAGRDLAPGDEARASTAVIVNQAFVTRVLGGGPALGRRLRYLGDVDDDAAATARPRGAGRWYEIVGVAADLQANAVDPTVVPPAVLYAAAPEHALGATLTVRVRGGVDAADVAPRLRALAVDVDPTLRMGATHTLADFERQSRLAVRLVGLVLGLVLLSVFLLSAAGVYALTSLTVTRRRREIGIRAALGAAPRQVLPAVLALVAAQVGAGLAVGVVGAAA